MGVIIEYEKRWNIANQLVEKLEKEHITAICLVGSVARKECYPSSDIDLIIISEKYHQYPVTWIEGLPVTISCQTLHETLHSNDVMKSELLKSKILYDPDNQLSQSIQEIHEQTTKQGKTITELKLGWLSKVSSEFKGYAEKTTDPYSAVAWHRVSTYYTIAHFLLSNHQVWKPRYSDIFEHLTEESGTIESIMQFNPIIEQKDVIQQFFKEFEEQLYTLIEIKRDKIDSKDYQKVIRRTSTSKSQLLGFIMDNGDYVNGVMGYRNILNQLYSYPIAKVYGHKREHYVGTMLHLKDPKSLPTLCKLVNAFDNDINGQLRSIKKNISKLSIISVYQ